MSEVKPVNILVAEDNEANLYFLKTILSGAGYAVTAANDGQLALNHFNEKDFDLILLDLFLPGINGCELLKIIRKRENENNKNYKVFAVTGSSNIVDRRDCELVDFDEWLFKPFTREDILNLIQKYFK